MFGMEILGVPLRITSADPSVEEEISDLLRDVARTTAPPRSVLRLAAAHDEVPAVDLWDGDTHLGRFTSRTLLVSFVIHALNRVAIDQTPLLTIHAGAVVRGGAALLLPGDAEVGKTTLTAALVQAGFSYLTDEAAGLAWYGRPDVERYPKPLSLSTASRAALGIGVDTPAHVERHLPASVLRPGCIADPAPVRWIVFPRYDPSVSTPALAPLARSEALLRLARCTFRFRERPTVVLTRLAEVVRAAECATLLSNDAGAAARLLEELTEGRATW